MTKSGGISHGRIRLLYEACSQNQEGALSMTYCSQSQESALSMTYDTALGHVDITLEAVVNEARKCQESALSMKFECCGQWSKNVPMFEVITSHRTVSPFERVNLVPQNPR